MLPISLTMAGIAALINIWLGMRVGEIRRREKISVGDGNNPKLIARMRAQANFIEYIPILLILIALIEFSIGGGESRTGPIWLWVVGFVIMLARVAHALGMDGTFKQGRAIGTMITLAALLGLGVYAIALATVIPYNPPTTIDNISDTE